MHVEVTCIGGTRKRLPHVCRADLSGVLIGWFAASRDAPELQAEIACLLQLTAAYSIIGGSCHPTCQASLHPEPCSRVHAIAALNGNAILYHTSWLTPPQTPL